MKNLLFIIYYLLFTICSLSQERNVDDILNYTLSARGLTRSDLTIPIDFYASGEKSPASDSKLLLPLVRDMMINPLRSMTWLDSLSGKSSYLSDIISYLYSRCLNMNYINVTYDIICPTNIEQVVQIMEQSSLNRKKEKTLLDGLTKEERLFLLKNLMSILEEEASDESNMNIFKYNEARDSSIKRSKSVMDLLSRQTEEEILKNSYLSECWMLYECVNWKANERLYKVNDEYVQGEYYYYSDNYGVRIAIGGPGRNIYTGSFDFILDLGGDDVYQMVHPSLGKGGQGGADKMGGFSCIIDLAGNDYYTTTSDFALAGGLFSSSFIFDKEGDDFYESKGSGNLGAAIGGLGLLYDEKGNDTYKGISFSIGAGCFGVGMLVDREGNDFYIANSYSQGFGMTQGVGAIIDNKGNDSYLVDSRSLDIGRYEDHYVSMCQGYGLGLRPFYAGGIGLIIEGEGNDIYNTDIFGQGGAYWYSLGAIVDKSGHDKYNGYQYSQGSGIHLAVGLLKDYDGWDFYQSNGVSQGCGHDFGYGMLWDVMGNDNYSAYSLSQGAGNANGIGLLIDESGVDGYLNKYPGNTRGYGNPRREFGSLGIFVDGSGSDFYSDPGMDSTVFNSSLWGVMNDYYYSDLPSQVSGDNYKVPVDSVDRPHDIPFTMEQYFIMAKTIEPRFSLWQEYGFRKLIEDSITTAGYSLIKLGTIDHREAQVLRVLSQKIQKSLSDALITKLNSYLLNMGGMTQPEVSMACYLFGETHDAAGKDILYQLTFDDNYKIRSSAINALGKIDYDTSDTEFIEKVSARLNELAGENSDKKLYNKDIAFALGNYKSSASFETLRSMLNNPFFGARFTAAENLGKFPQLPYMLHVDGLYPAIPQEEIPLITFMHALGQLKEGDFIAFVSSIKTIPAAGSEPVILNLIEIIKHRRERSTDAAFINWSNDELNELNARVNLKVK